MRNTLPLSSFPLQALLSFEKYFQMLETLGCCFLLIFKCYSLPYTPSKSAQEVVILFVFFLITMLRIRLGSSANKTENSDKILWFMLLTLLCILGAFYFVFLQYYILLVEVILYAVTLVLQVFELLISFACFWQFKSYEKQQ